MHYGEHALNDSAIKWDSKYSYAIKSWRDNWEGLTIFFEFALEIRKTIYITNLIKNLNRKIRKYIKNKLSFLQMKLYGISLPCRK